MNKIIITIAITGILAVLLIGCAGNNYDPYDNRGSQDRKLDYVAQDTMYDATSKLSTQDIKNLNNLK